MKITKIEIVKIIAAIKIQCPEALPYKNEAESDILVDMWFDILKDYPKEVVWAAVRKALRNTVFQKQNWIGAICQEIEQMQVAFEKSDLELWTELTGVLHEVHRNYYAFRFNAIEDNGKTQGDIARERVAAIFEGLSPELKEYCRTQRGLIEIAEYTDEQLSYERGRFMKTIPQIKTRERVRKTTPTELAKLIQGVEAHVSIEGNSQKLLK